MNELQTVCEYLTEGDWFQDYYDDISMSAGCDVVGLSVELDSVTLHGHEKYGDGSEPYALNPERHLDDLNHDTRESSEGYVEYNNTPNGLEDPLRLPKHLYFTEKHTYPEPTTISDLEERLNSVLDVPVDLDSVVEVAKKNGDIS